VIAFPEWYLPGFPDQEILVMDWLQPLFDLCDPAPYACTSLPDDLHERIGAGQAVVRVYRGGGPGVDSAGVLDHGLIQLGGIARTRAEAWAVIGFCIDMILAANRGFDIKLSAQKIGPQQIPELNPDSRLVSVAVEVVTRKSRTVPDYARLLEQLGL
jgi:hypothetical protein